MANPVTIDDMRRVLGKKDIAEPVGRAKVEDDGSVAIYETTLAALGDKVTDYAKGHFKPAITKVIAETTAADVGKLRDALMNEWTVKNQELTDLANSTRVVEIRTPLATKVLKGVHHNQFENLLTVVNANLPVLMVGPAGTGKTQGAENVADALGLDFYSISVGSQTSKSDLQGYMDANHNYVATQFRHAYEKGGVFLLDEADAGNSNVLILLNAALSNGYMAFPDGMIKAHENFRMVATANTFGHGASRQYVGRNQLDAATLDRFVVISWDIDEHVERAMAGPTDAGKKWLRVVHAVRKKVVDELELRVVVSPRATLRGSRLLSTGMPFEDVLSIALIGNMPAHVQQELNNIAHAAWIK